MAKQRIDSADTVDNVTHLLHRLQADGWATKNANVEFDYKNHLPVGVVVTVELVPRG
jgi:hypothetical protein